MWSGDTLDDVDDAEYSDEVGKPAARVNRLSRTIHGWSWQAFPIGMGTGAVYVCLAGVDPAPPRTLRVIQTMFYFMNMGLFVINTTTLFLQLLLYPRQAKRLVTDPSKGIFVPLMVLAFATIIIGTVNYALDDDVYIPPMLVYVLFWARIARVLPHAYGMVQSTSRHDDVYSGMGVFGISDGGIVACNVLRVLDPASNQALGVMLTGYIFQGLGFFMTLFYICIYVMRIMTTGFLEGHQANGAFVACGPPGFTALALVNLGDAARSILVKHNLVSPIAGEVWFAASVLSALLLFGLALFFFAFGAIPYWFKLHKRLSEILGCWALTFPNVGWILTMRKFGDIFDLPFFTICSFIMSVFMCIAWLILFGLTVLALWKGKIFTATHEEALRDARGSKRPDLELALMANSQIGVHNATTRECTSTDGERAGEVSPTLSTAAVVSGPTRSSMVWRQS
ncbi:hypothetical protein EIP91_006227 [Steccherinum ochraceum]|uniref:Uncharacterized protein n=1 Tax=Steccherinum ochraceum TaxID=92696 RepID=A0A4R0REE8_9APHY|nr:hypothetical protein EIP91_006227 [Steccherinum ochraceum]